MILVDKSDFKGKWEIAQNNFSNLDSYIERYEKAILVDLMGKYLADDFISDPTDTKWDDLKSVGFGLTSLLVGFIYFEYVRDLPFRVTNQGVVYQLDDNASQVITVLALKQRYNECVSDYRSMQRLLRSNFNNFHGKRRKYIIN